MNWGAVGAIWELAGAIGAIVPIAYLAVQIRQNTRAVRGSTAHAIVERQQSELH